MKCQRVLNNKTKVCYILWSINCLLEATLSLKCSQTPRNILPHFMPHNSARGHNVYPKAWFASTSAQRVGGTRVNKSHVFAAFACSPVAVFYLAHTPRQAMFAARVDSCHVLQPFTRRRRSSRSGASFRTISSQNQLICIHSHSLRVFQLGWAGSSHISIT